MEYLVRRGVRVFGVALRDPVVMAEYGALPGAVPHTSAASEENMWGEATSMRGEADASGSGVRALLKSPGRVRPPTLADTNHLRRRLPPLLPTPALLPPPLPTSTPTQHRAQHRLH